MAKESFWGRLWGNVIGTAKTFENAFNKAFLQFMGGQAAQYDYKDSTYLEKGYGINPDVFSVVTQMCDKTKAVPYAVKKVKDKQSLSKLSSLRNATNGNYSTKQLANKFILESKAYEDKEMPFPLEKPNPNQTWGDIHALYKLFLKMTGNFYLYMVWPENGANSGVPKLVYVLPSHKIKIVLKKDADLIYDEDPIDYYMLRDGEQNLTFPAEQVIHIKTPNPFFDMQGGHLYGLSPIRALLRNIESSNEALNNNVKTLKNSGVFGFFSGKDSAMTPDQAMQLKQRLVDMDMDAGRLAKIAGLSVPIEFTKLSVDTKDMLPFDYLKYDQKAICNVLGWSDALLNNDDGGKYDKQKEERKRVITDNIQPDLILFDQAMTERFIRRFKGYENAVLEHDISELPEMQEDYKIMLEWMEKAYYTPNEIRAATKAETLDIDGMNVPWIDGGKKRIDDVGITASDVQKSYEYLKNDIV
ncbi:phage portal protein, HK97 family [Chryseobacterium oranimense]|uniref:Phage portal protein, HK97 family n=1 Tax=Chryseobacterium oranimense TaxID=421058 RepID=A0A1M5V1N8_9FLAO|nr:phage portal protein [Chryseobacterium oranimense]SHH69064.1 phage portal protein, HK97 family [Chryseobacterium oranimense]